MSKPTLDLLSAYFNEELVHDRPGLRESLVNGGPEGVDRVRYEFRDLLAARALDHDAFWKATSMYFVDDETMYRELESAYRFFFDDEPPSLSADA